MTAGVGQQHHSVHVTTNPLQDVEYKRSGIRLVLKGNYTQKVSKHPREKRCARQYRLSSIKQEQYCVHSLLDSLIGIAW